MMPARCYKCGCVAFHQVVRLFPSGCRATVNVCGTHTTRYDVYAKES